MQREVIRTNCGVEKHNFKLKTGVKIQRWVNLPVRANCHVKKHILKGNGKSQNGQLNGCVVMQREVMRTNIRTNCHVKKHILEGNGKSQNVQLNGCVVMQREVMWTNVRTNCNVENWDKDSEMGQFAR
jgi:hypothetical protein